MMRALGYWRYSIESVSGEPSESAAVYEVGDDDRPAREVTRLDECLAPKTQNAYARLFAAAPDLLTALKAMDAATLHCGYDCEQGAVMEATTLARAAIAKAEGRS